MDDLNALQRSWEITKLSFGVIKKDKELLLFPILSGIFSIIFILAMAFPFFLSPLILGGIGGAASAALFYLVLFIIYLGLAFIATFFNVCTVYTIKKRFQGGNATFFESLGFAFSRVHLIISWSLLSATVGLLLRIIESIGERLGPVGELIINITTSILGLVWSILTIFVVPSMVFKGLGPFDAVKDSVATLKKTWGESLIRAIGTEILSGFFFVVGFLAVIFTIVFLPLSPLLIAIVLLIGLVYLVMIFTVFTLINAVFNTALYVYADTGKIPAFNEHVLKDAFARRNK